MSAEIVPETPEPLLKGKFAIFETPGGGIHLALRADGEDEERHIDIPPMLVKMASKGRDPFALLKGLRS